MAGATFQPFETGWLGLCDDQGVVRSLVLRGPLSGGPEV